jgi:hypothetical protein
MLDKLENVLRLYFNDLDNTNKHILGSAGTQFLNAPYGAFSDMTDQTAASTTAAYAITFNTTDLSNGVTVSSSSHINVAHSGVYNVQFSIQFTNSGSQIYESEVWLRKNGTTDVPNSNSVFSIPERHGSVDGHVIGALNLFVSLTADDYVELMWCTNSTTVSLQHITAGTSPTRPATPSVILTATFVSNVLP